VEFYGKQILQSGAGRGNVWKNVDRKLGGSGGGYECHPVFGCDGRNTEPDSTTRRNMDDWAILTSDRDMETAEKNMQTALNSVAKLTR
jgi:hypothetical protein